MATYILALEHDETAGTVDVLRRDLVSLDDDALDAVIEDVKLCPSLKLLSVRDAMLIVDDNFLATYNLELLVLETALYEAV